MADHHGDATREFRFLSRLVTDDYCTWLSVHPTLEDAERQLRAVADRWGVGFTPDGEPADGFLSYGVEDDVEVFEPGELGKLPKKRIPRPISKEEDATWEWLGERRDVPGGLSADEMADDFGITRYVAARRLIRATARGLAHEVSPGRYRVGSKDA
jgi:hypothetical protein